MSFVVGGFWGLLAISYPVFLRVFRDRAISETALIVWRVACLPAYLAEMLIPSPSWYVFLLPYFVVSILFGITICIVIENLVDKFRKNKIRRIML